MPQLRRPIISMAIALGMTLPIPAAAQFDLSGFVGPVTISHYRGCEGYFCVGAAIGVGQNSSGRYFARLLSFSDSFDEIAFNAVGPDRYVGHSVQTIEAWYAEPHPLDPDEGEWHFLTASLDERYTTHDYGTFINPGRLVIGYVRSEAENYPDGDTVTTEWGAMFSPAWVTVTPEPATFALVGIGMAVLPFIARRRRGR